MATFSRDYPDGFVVDASFLVALVSLNPDAKRFAHLLKTAVTNAVNVGEVFYTTYRNSGIASAQIERAFGALGLSIDPVTIEMVRHFSDLKDVDAKRVLQQQNAGLVGQQVKKLSLGDLTCLSQGLVLGLPVLTGDKHWATLVPHGLPVAVVDFRDLQIVP